MKLIKNEKDFYSWIVNADPDYDDNNFRRNEYRLEGASLYIEDFHLDEEDLDNKSFISTTFVNCTFKSCIFNSAIFQSCNFYNCEFLVCSFNSSKIFESDLHNCEFKWCEISDLELVDINIESTIFIDCNEIIGLKIRGYDKRTVTFESCDLLYLDIYPSKKDSSDEYLFSNCIIKESNFNRLNFTKSSFTDCSLSLNQFSFCELSRSTIDESNDTPGNEFSMIDFRTILNSAPLDKVVLDNIFGIHNAEIKDYLIDLTAKIEFQSIFISYSFKDKSFAKTINEHLMKRGILTFLWENDAPGGKTLDEIMSSNVREKDRVLFIASKSSLVSKACHFELSEGRKKQELIWDDVLFPIHIDNFLFEIEKNKIRPIDKQNEYWQNIVELKKLNSLDFSQYIKLEGKENREFERSIFRLIKGLRKEH